MMRFLDYHVFHTNPPDGNYCLSFSFEHEMFMIHGRSSFPLERGRTANILASYRFKVVAFIILCVVQLRQHNSVKKKTESLEEIQFSLLAKVRLCLACRI